ncbi:MAG: class I SAM-dependent methyltransferase [Kofleriaceae bacterium]
MPAPLDPRSTTAAEGRPLEERNYYQTNADLYGSRLASVYDAVTLPLHWLRRRVVRMAAAEAGTRVLDVATGTGGQARAFAEVDANVVGVDLSARMLEIARRKSRASNTTFVEADATALPFGDESFDVGCISLALHEMPPSIRTRAVRELARVTRRGGIVVVVDFARPHNRIWRAMVVRVLSEVERDAYPEFVRSDLGALLAQHGIAVVRVGRALLDTAQIVIGIREESSGLPRA